MLFDRGGIGVPHLLLQLASGLGDLDELTALVHLAFATRRQPFVDQAVDQPRGRILRQQHLLFQFDRAHIALHEAGLPHQLVKVDLRAKKTENGDDYTSINPKGQVPALVLDNGELLTEGPVIVQAIADKAAAKNLAPAAGSPERYRLQ